MKRFRALFILFSVLSSACSADAVHERHNEAVRDGYDVMPIAKSLVERFGGWSFITHWNIRNDPQYGLRPNEKQWQTLFYAYGRYEVQFVQLVQLNNNGGRVIGPVGEAEIVIKEISRIFEYESSRATDFTRFQHRLNGEEVSRVFEANWDFSVVGIDLIKDMPVENIEWKYDYWNRIYPLQRNVWTGSDHNGSSSEPHKPTINTP